MEGIRAYLLSVVAAAIISALVMKLVGNKSAYCGIIKLVTGIFLSITVVSPLVQITFTDMTDYFETLDIKADAVVSDGVNSSHAAMTEIIKENTEAYILDKAENMGLTVNVTVYLSDDTPPTPISVKISGSAAPYAKMQLQSIIESDLSIPKENQAWI